MAKGKNIYFMVITGIDFGGNNKRKAQFLDLRAEFIN